MVDRPEVDLDKIRLQERRRVWTLIELDLLIPESIKPRIKSLIIKEDNDKLIF
jgi:hypothetical protein